MYSDKLTIYAMKEGSISTIISLGCELIILGEILTFKPKQVSFPSFFFGEKDVNLFTTRAITHNDSSFKSAIIRVIIYFTFLVSYILTKCSNPMPKSIKVR